MDVTDRLQRGDKEAEVRLRQESLNLYRLINSKKRILFFHLIHLFLQLTVHITRVDIYTRFHTVRIIIIQRYTKRKNEPLWSREAFRILRGFSLGSKDPNSLQQSCNLVWKVQKGYSEVTKTLKWSYNETSKGSREGGGKLQITRKAKKILKGAIEGLQEGYKRFQCKDD